MKNLDNPINALLDGLDHSLNANAVWLHFDINNIKQFDLATFLGIQLKTGYFHYMLVQNDIERGWENYVAMVFPQNKKKSYLLLQKPGTTWNGNEVITTNIITEDVAKKHITELLLFERASALNTPAEKKITQETAVNLTNHFFSFIQESEKNDFLFYAIQPNFLWSTTDTLESTNDFTHLGYFDGFGRDFVLGIIVHNKKAETSALKILMTNGYG